MYKSIWKQEIKPFLPRVKEFYYGRREMKVVNQTYLAINRILNTEWSYKRQGHAPLKHFVGFLYNGGKPE